MSLISEFENEKVDEMKREMEWREFNDVRSSNIPDGR